MAGPSRTIIPKNPIAWACSFGGNVSRMMACAMGIMALMVESGEQAARLVASAKYPPIGRRGAAFGVAHDDYTGGKRCL